MHVCINTCDEQKCIHIDMCVSYTYILSYIHVYTDREEEGDSWNFHPYIYIYIYNTDLDSSEGVREGLVSVERLFT